MGGHRKLEIDFFYRLGSDKWQIKKHVVIALILSSDSKNFTIQLAF